MTTAPRRPVRIAGCSGSTTDRRDAMKILAANHPNDPIDVMIGDWMSEGNMTVRAGGKVDGADISYEPTFLEALSPALPYLAQHKIKLAVNAGASDTEKLYRVVTELIKQKELNLQVAWISGDEVLPTILQHRASNDTQFENIYTGEVLKAWKFEPIYAQAYLGGLGIATAFSCGADIVICGRVSDASPVIGAAYWWHNWQRSDLKQLANAFVAGHLIECSSYVCGGNYSGFKALEATGWVNIGYPIAEISADGQVIITKNIGSEGEVSVGTCTAQLLYEIQGPWYFNSDVTAILDEISFSQLATNRVALHGVKYDLPPPTTKVGITAKGGYQAEMHWFLVGLDVPSKARMLQAQILKLLKPYSHRFSRLEFTTNGTSPDNPPNQNAATVDFRVVAQAREAEWLAPACFVRPCIDPIMAAYPGATPHLDLRQAFPREIWEYYVTLLPQAVVDHRVHLASGESVSVPPPVHTKAYPKQQPSFPATSNAVTLSSFGATTPGPLGWLVHARSGDKGSDCNVGFFLPAHLHNDVGAWDWLRNLLSVGKVIELLGDEYSGKAIDRFELPGLKAVHFLLHEHLDRGVSCTTRYDFLGKNVAEYLRARWVQLPMRFFEKGRL